MIAALILVAAAFLNLGTQSASAKSTGKRIEHIRAAVAAGAAAPPSLALPSPPARFFSINQVLAQRAGQPAVHGHARFAAANPLGSPKSLADAQASPWGESALGSEPFGLFTFRAPEGALWAKWRLLEQDIRREASVLARCRTEPDRCPSEARLFLNMILELAGHEGRSRLEFVNRHVNASIQYQSDVAQHGMPDLWSAPLATLASGRGDCEDYAITKYVALREAGMAEDDLATAAGKGSLCAARPCRAGGPPRRQVADPRQSSPSRQR
jgi:predicted transglutaminase-like cysteine proteinase